MGSLGSVLLGPLGDSRKQNSELPPTPPTGKKFGAFFTISCYTLLEGSSQRQTSLALAQKTLRPRVKGAYRRQPGDRVRVSTGQRVGTVGGVWIMKTLAVSYSCHRYELVEKHLKLSRGGFSCGANASEENPVASTRDVL